MHNKHTSLSINRMLQAKATWIQSHGQTPVWSGRAWKHPGIVRFQQSRHQHTIGHLLVHRPPDHFLPRIKACDISSCSLMMAARTMGTALAMTSLVVVLVALALSRAAAQGNGCSSVMMTLSPCMDFISNKAPIPGMSCCSVLAGVVQTDPRCLCMVLDGTAATFGISINQTRALELPGVTAPWTHPTSVHVCMISGVPTAPAPTPSSKSGATEEEEADAAADAHSGNGTSRSTNSKNAASLMATMLIPICALLYVF